MNTIKFTSKTTLKLNNIKYKAYLIGDLPPSFGFKEKFDGQDDDGNAIAARWLQTRIGQGYTAKDRSGKLEAFEDPNLTALIEKLGFSNKIENKESA